MPSRHRDRSDGLNEVSRADSSAQFREAAKALNEAADKGLRREVYAGFRKAAKPLGERMISQGAAEMPHHGGLAARIAASKLAQSNSTTGRNPSITLSLRSREGYDLKAMDAGILRHPVFGRWLAGVKPQRLRPGAFTRPFEAGADGVRKEVIAALNRVNDQIVKQSGGRL